MKRFLGGSIAAALVLATAACQPETAKQLNTGYSQSKVYIGALTCNVTGSSGYVIGSTRDLSCVYTTKAGVEQAYDGKIRRFGIDLGTTKPGHVIWKVFQLGGLVGADLSTDPKVLVGSYGGEQASLTAGTSAAGGNWLYGGSNNQIVLQATELQTSGSDDGYNVAYGIAEITLSLKN
jgi:Protein of unknown function (DUF992)